MTRVRRALLYMPGNEMRKIEKASRLGVDTACLDLEDAVAFNRKAEARATVVQALNTLDFGRTERLVRINPVGSGLESDDLAAVLPAHPDGVVIPKVQKPDDIGWTSSQIAAYERAQGWLIGGIRLLAIIESARAIVHLPQIAAADPRLDALIFGAEDLAADMGAVRTREGLEVLYARSAVALHAAAFGLQAVDMVFVDFHDEAGLREEARQGAEFGYTGKQIIHPGQVAPVHEAFTPDDASIVHAQRVVQAHADAQASGSGAFALDSKMVDMPIVKEAERLLARARAAGKLS